LIGGVAGIGTTNGSKVAMRSMIFFFVATFLAAILGMLLVITIKPGKNNASIVENSFSNKNIHLIDTILDLIRNCFPDNIVKSNCAVKCPFDRDFYSFSCCTCLIELQVTFSKYQTKLVAVNKTIKILLGDRKNSSKLLLYSCLASLQ
jgi:hypothetical protein